MPYQFSCPNGHVLEAEESYAGQQTQCPECAAAFVIPQPQFVGAGGTSPAGGFPAIGPGAAAAARFESPAGPRLLHIPCPNGHELETPPDMIGQEVLCPHCGEQFLLREKDSIEHKRRRREERERKERKASNLWFNAAITVAVVVVLGLVILIALSSQS